MNVAGSRKGDHSEPGAWSGGNDCGIDCGNDWVAPTSAVADLDDADAIARWWQEQVAAAGGPTLTDHDVELLLINHGQLRSWRGMHRTLAAVPVHARHEVIAAMAAYLRTRHRRVEPAGKTRSGRLLTELVLECAPWVETWAVPWSLVPTVVSVTGALAAAGVQRDWHDRGEPPRNLVMRWADGGHSPRQVVALTEEFRTAHDDTADGPVGVCAICSPGGLPWQERFADRATAVWQLRVSSNTNETAYVLTMLAALPDVQVAVAAARAGLTIPEALTTWQHLPRDRRGDHGAPSPAAVTDWLNTLSAMAALHGMA